FMAHFFDQFSSGPPIPVGAVWIPPIFLGLAALLCLLALSSQRWRAKLRWRLPAFREASLAQLASALALMLRNGATLPEALALAEALEADTPAGISLGQWRKLVEAGQGKPAQWSGYLSAFPPMFLWLVQKGGENLAAGFQKAADLYHSRA